MLFRSNFMNNENNSVFLFEKLTLYQKSLDFIDSVYAVANTFPISEKYNLSDQLLRAATSVALNIGEGAGGASKEFLSFLRISRRSIQECIVCTTIAHRRRYINSTTELQLRIKLIELAKMNSGLRQSIKRRINS